jgi:hypothetical protein
VLAKRGARPTSGVASADTPRAPPEIAALIAREPRNQARKREAHGRAHRDHRRRLDEHALSEPPDDDATPW